MVKIDWKYIFTQIISSEISIIIGYKVNESYILIFRSQREVTSAVLRYSYPGYHLQAAVLQASASIPSFRKVLSSPRIGDAPAKFPIHGAFVEGWGLYSEYLGEELELYQDPYQR